MHIFLQFAAAVGVALDFGNQCMDCHYKVGSVVGPDGSAGIVR